MLLFVTLLNIDFLRKTLLSFTRPQSKGIFIAIHPETAIFLTPVRAGLSHLKKHLRMHKFKYNLSFLRHNASYMQL